MPRVGIITGTDREAACLDVLPAGALPPVACTGGSAARAEMGARRLLDAGCAALASFGTAGGLQPGLASGTLVLPSGIVGDGKVLSVDAAWRARLGSALDDAGLPHIAGMLACSGTVLHSVAEKRALLSATGAAAVDMESLPAARIAAEAGVPFIAVRVVIDAADRALPYAASAAMGADGSVRIGRLLAALAARPQELGALCGLARASRRAFGVLRRVAALAGPSLAF